MIYTSPKLEFLGTIAGLTASDHKCTPGGDDGWTFWKDENVGEGSVWRNANGDEEFSMPIPGHDCITRNTPGDAFDDFPLVP